MKSQCERPKIPQREIEPGTWVRMKVRTMFGWNWIGVVADGSRSNGVILYKQEYPHEQVDCCRHEVAIMRRQDRDKGRALLRSVQRTFGEGARTLEDGASGLIILQGASE